MDQDEIEVRRVQAYTGERSLTVILPKEFANDLGIGKGDFLKVTRTTSQLILEKAEL